MSSARQTDCVLYSFICDATSRRRLFYTANSKRNYRYQVTELITLMLWDRSKKPRSRTMFWMHSFIFCVCVARITKRNGMNLIFLNHLLVTLQFVYFTVISKLRNDSKKNPRQCSMQRSSYTSKKSKKISMKFSSENYLTLNRSQNHAIFYVYARIHLPPMRGRKLFEN